MTFILFLILLFIAIPYIVKLLLRIFSWYISRKVVRQQQQAYQEMYERMNRRQREQRRGGWTGPSDSYSSSSSSHRGRGKRIDPSVGEYVDYEDIEGSTRTSGGSQTETRYTAESQIVDVEWEDIK